MDGRHELIGRSVRSVEFEATAGERHDGEALVRLVAHPDDGQSLEFRKSGPQLVRTSHLREDRKVRP